MLEMAPVRNPHFSQSAREMGHPEVDDEAIRRGLRPTSPLLAKVAQKWGQPKNPHFSQRTREMGHPRLSSNKKGSIRSLRMLPFLACYLVRYCTDALTWASA